VHGRTMEGEELIHGDEKGASVDEDDVGTTPVVRVLTQNMNIHHFVAHSYPNRGARMRGLLAQVDAFDVVLLQELFTLHLPWGTAGGSWRDKVVACWPHGFSASCASPSSWFTQDAGLLILSKYPIVESKTLPFKHYSLQEVVCRKGALMAKIKVSNHEPSRHLIAITAHLDAHSAEVRLLQLTQIMEELVNQELEQDPEAQIILGGDLNIDSIGHQEAWKAAKDILYPLKNAFDEQAATSGGTNKTARDHEIFPITHTKVPQCLDHIFSHGTTLVSDSLVVEKYSAPEQQDPENDSEQAHLISDHYGISVSFAL